jgi:dolichol-phosphate mannosyltransferase
MEFSIVVPVYNEAGNVRPQLLEIGRALAGRCAWEVIYVDDCSQDGTRDELQAAQLAAPRLRVLHHAKRCGQSSALLTGVRAARAPWIITLDGDGQNDPADIPLLLDRLASENAGTCWLLFAGHRTRRQDNLVKRLSSRIANAVRRRLLKDATPDTGCGLKLFPREAYLALPAFDHMHRFLPALMQRQGVHVISVPVRHRARRYGRSKYGINNRLWVGLVDMVGVMWLQHRQLGGSLTTYNWFTRFGDNLGVAWLQRRPCNVGAQEESRHV